jgi:hypothetical protein
MLPEPVASGSSSGTSVARVSQKLGPNTLSEQELAKIATLPRKDRRKLISELRRAGRREWKGRKHAPAAEE